jgi:hypothetical protein
MYKLPSIYFHEDDYRQTELLPLSALSDGVEEMNHIDESLENTGMGAAGLTSKLNTLKE